MSLFELMTQKTVGEAISGYANGPALADFRQETARVAVWETPSATKTPGPNVLYAATSLESWETDTPRYFARDFVIDGVCYRRLDPEYYAWLRHKMTHAKKALEAGRLDPIVFEELRTRFNGIHAWAVERFGEGKLLAAVRSFDPRTYLPPTLDMVQRYQERFTPNDRPEQTPREPTFEPYLYPKEGDWHFTEKILPTAVAKVDAIRDQAIQLGWKEARLYQNRGRFRFPCGEDYGLVCFVGDNQRIGDVTRQYIEIIGPPPRENRLRFHNPEMDQPWIKKIEPKA